MGWSVGNVVLHQRIRRAALAVRMNVQPVPLPLFGTKRVSLLVGEARLLRVVLRVTTNVAPRGRW